MSVMIEDREVEKLAEELALLRGTSVSQAVAIALQHDLDRERLRAEKIERILSHGLRLQALPVLDDRSPDEILGYDENGLPT